jgi:23S rRNA (pseudouridine1915-N3)-methyltransferase
MALHIIAIGQNLPNYMNEAISHYLKLIPPPYKPHIKAIPTNKNSTSLSPSEIKSFETRALIAAIPSDSLTIALDQTGHAYDNVTLARNLNHWLQQHKNIVFLIGGSHGLDTSYKQHIDQQWSLSTLTFPHSLARLITIEQIYRSIMILSNHPYHK